MIEQENLPIEIISSRYYRQILIPQFGIEGQEKIGSSRVVVIGAGGLGSPVLIYLAAAGIGHITIIDFDSVDKTNLNRQVLHGEEDIGRIKVESAKESLERLNSTIEISIIPEKLTEENAEALLTNHDVIIDCVDNVQTRLLVNRWAVLLNIPLIEGGVEGFHGFVMRVRPESPCLGCLWGDTIPPQRPIAVLGSVAGIIGAFQATLCLKTLLRIDKEQEHYNLWVLDLLDMQMKGVPLEKNAMCPLCGT